MLNLILVSVDARINYLGSDQSEPVRRIPFVHVEMKNEEQRTKKPNIEIEIYMKKS